MIRCRSCLQPFDVPSFPHRCPKCGGLFGFVEGIKFSPDNMRSGMPGIWTYKDSFCLPNDAPVISLGEGNTPLVWAEISGVEVGLKMESLNPTGSFKDRGTTVLVSWLMAAGVQMAVEDSSGNAGASFAAYASRAGIQGKVFIPSYASGPKRSQIEGYGLDVVPVPGPRSQAARAVLEEVKQGAVYASHAYLPQGIAGMATIAYELVTQLGGSPDSVLIPVGHGSLLLGISLGFEALLASGEISRIPKLIGIQAAVCDPLYRAFTSGEKEPVPVSEGKTVAEGVAIAEPYHGSEVLAAVRRSGGKIIHVGEDRIREGQIKLARMGFDVELTSALIWDGIEQLQGELVGSVICIITGHGLKNE